MGAVRRQETERGRAAAEEVLSGAAAGAGPVLPGAGPDAWTAFDQAFRSYPRYRCDAADRPEAALCHPDGRIRQQALSAPRPTPELVAIRCADWAPAVRRRARRVLADLLAADPRSALLRLTPLVLRLGRREQGAWALELFEGALRAAAGGPALAALHDSPDLPARRLAARIAVEAVEAADAAGAGAAELRELARRAAAEPDPATGRTWTDAALALAAASAGGPDAEAVDTLLGGHVPMVRSAGVTLLRRAGRAAEAGRYLGDRSGLVRACARWAVRQDGGDPYALTRAHVTGAGLATAAAVLGFAECAGREDAPLLRALTDHPVGAVRAGAVTGLRLLDTYDAALLEPLLDDPCPAVARAVALSLSGSADRPSTGRLLERVGPARPPHTRRAAYRLLRARGGMPALRASVELLADGDPGLRALAAHTVRAWNWQYALHTGETDAAELGGLLRRSAEAFDAHQLGLRLSRIGLSE
ncbi:hypothetical protein [Streptomyces sp. NPDC058613]|uniref:hypothetical protein n=1 Tax=unclassified Streptomyces TaxID=2593676 RepID=UPI00365D40AD